MKRAHWGDKGAPGMKAPSTTIHVDDLMAGQVVTLERHTTVGHARRLMSEHGIHCLPVEGADGEAVGIVTSSDLIEDVKDATPVSTVMTKDVQTVARYAAPAVAAGLMRKRRIHHLVVTEEKKIIGVLSSFDLLQLVEEKRFVWKNAPGKPKKATWERKQGRKGNGGS